MAMNTVDLTFHVQLGARVIRFLLLISNLVNIAHELCNEHQGAAVDGKPR